MAQQSLSRQESRLITRKRLRDAALKIFAKKGVRGAGIEQIARMAGYTRGAFYSNYASKLELLIDILNEQQLEEIKAWRSHIVSAEDPDQGLEYLTHQYDDRESNIQRAMINVELQLEADRNPVFNEVFEQYLDSLYAELRRFYIVLLARFNKAPPEHLDSLVVATRLLGLGLGSRTSLGKPGRIKKTQSEVMLDFIHTVIDAAPDME